MKVAITGARGLFGYGLTEIFGAHHGVTDLGHQEADITRPEELRAVFARIRPDVGIHSAAIPDLDICAADPDRAFLVNDWTVTPDTQFVLVLPPRTRPAEGGGFRAPAHGGGTGCRLGKKVRALRGRGRRCRRSSSGPTWGFTPRPG